MTILYDAAAPAADSGPRPLSGPAARMPAYNDLPDLYSRPRRRLHPMIAAGLAFVGSVVALYGAEAVLPPDYKPSHFVGGYAGAIAEARATGELAAKVKYDAKLKLIETGAARWQEQCKAGLQNLAGLYQASYQRANTGFQMLAAMQQQYASVRYSIVQQSVGGEIGAANTATSLGYLLGFFDPELGEKSMAFAEAARQQALQKLDAAAQSGVTVTMEGWDQGLPNPAALPKMIDCEMPASVAELVEAPEGAAR